MGRRLSWGQRNYDPKATISALSGKPCVLQRRDVVQHHQLYFELEETYIVDVQKLRSFGDSDKCTYDLL